MGNAFVHAELNTTDVEKAKASMRRFARDVMPRFRDCATATLGAIPELT